MHCIGAWFTLFLCSSASLFLSVNGYKSNFFPFLPHQPISFIPRGGATTSEHGTTNVENAPMVKSSVAIINALGVEKRGTGVLASLVGNNVTTTHTMLLYGNSKETPLFILKSLVEPNHQVNNSSEYHVLATIGLLCDVLVLHLPTMPQKEILLSFGSTLVSIAQERKARNLPKGRLIVVTEAANDSWWIQEIVQGSFKEITPHFWEQFDILTPSQLNQQWPKPIQSTDEGILSDLLPYTDNENAISELLRRVYLSRQPVEQGSNYDGDIIFQVHPINKVAMVVDNGPDNIHSIVSQAHGSLTELESQMFQVQLDGQSENKMPLLDFSDQANRILQTVYSEISPCTDNERVVTTISPLVLEVQRLYQDHVQALRDYYGRRYEAALEKEQEVDNSADDDISATEAQHLTQAFRAAAQHAVPQICQDGGHLATIVPFDYIPSLEGLVQDMMEATRLSKKDVQVDDSTENLGMKRRLQVPKWVKKVASRVLVLAVNYLQGWLAWQAVKRAAMERDREMPKFPLF